MARDSITVNQNTTLDQVRQFIESHQDDGSKLYAKKNDDGETILYMKDASAKSDKWQLKSRPDGFGLVSKAKYKKELARQAIREVIQNTFGERMQALKEGPGALKSKGFLQVSALVMDNPLQEGNAFARRGGAVNASLLSNFADKAERLITRLETVAAKKAEKIPDRFEMPATSNKVLFTGAEIRSKSGKMLPMHDIRVDGTDYRAQRFLGEGAAGQVVLYREKGVPEGEAHQLAVKLQPKNSPGKLDTQDLLREYYAAERIGTDSTRAHAMLFDKVVPMFDDKLMLAGDFAPNGDLSDMANKLAEATQVPGEGGKIEAGKITPQERNLIALTLIKDGAQGLQALHYGTGAVHSDVKSQNLAIDENGVARLIDFGMSTGGDTIRPHTMNTAEAALYLGPEVSAANKEVISRRDGGQDQTREAFRQDLREYLGVFLMEGDDRGPGFDKLAKTVSVDLNNDIFGMLIDGARDVSFSGRANDVWGLGTAAYELMKGGFLIHERVESFFFEAEKTAAMAEWGRMEGARAVGARGEDDKLPAEVLAEGTGDDGIDAFLNDLLDPNPRTRLSAGEVTREPVMSRRGVGSDEVRELMLAVRSGDAGRIDEARRNVQKYFA